MVNAVERIFTALAMILVGLLGLLFWIPWSIIRLRPSLVKVWIVASLNLAKEAWNGEGGFTE